MRSNARTLVHYVHRVHRTGGTLLGITLVSNRFYQARTVIHKSLLHYEKWHCATEAGHPEVCRLPHIKHTALLF